MTESDDVPDDVPNPCPKCGGAPTRAPVGWVCEDCRSWLNTIDEQGIDVAEGGDG